MSSLESHRCLGFTIVILIFESCHILAQIDCLLWQIIGKELIKFYILDSFFLDVDLDVLSGNPVKILLAHGILLFIFQCFVSCYGRSFLGVSICCAGCRGGSFTSGLKLRNFLSLVQIVCWDCHSDICPGRISFNL